MGMSTLSVKARLFGTLSLLAVAMIGVGMLGLSQLHAANDRMDEIYNHNFKAAARVDRIAALRRDSIRALDVALPRERGHHARDRDDRHASRRRRSLAQSR